MTRRLSGIGVGKIAVGVGDQFGKCNLADKPIWPGQAQPGQVVNYNSTQSDNFPTDSENSPADPESFPADSVNFPRGLPKMLVGFDEPWLFEDFSAQGRQKSENGLRKSTQNIGNPHQMDDDKVVPKRRGPLGFFVSFIS